MSLPYRHVTREMNASRIISHGKITDLSEDFSLSNDIPFSIFIIPKSEIAVLEATKVISVKLYQEATHSDCPFAVGGWNETSIVSIEANASLLDDYDIYWGAGQKVEE